MCFFRHFKNAKKKEVKPLPVPIQDVAVGESRCASTSSNTSGQDKYNDFLVNDKLKVRGILKMESRFKSAKSLDKLLNFKILL
jgi:hypothetical protein